jgi:hypothetical protein
VTATKIIRKVMREHGKTRIYTNKLKNGRTVKCYTDAIIIDYDLIADIKKALRDADYDYHVRLLEGDSWSIGDSLIVEVPFEKDEA